MKPDGELLRLYAETRSEDAFAELVRRHLGLVHSAALRQLDGNTHLAQDVAQTVFTDLARKAADLLLRPVLTGWLYRSTIFAAAKAARTEHRRQRHEQDAHVMDELLQPTAPDLEWERLRPVLDQAMNELNESDRDAILMRYFENRQLADVGASLGLSHDAARKRVDRALEKLREILLKRGFTAAATLAAVLSANAVQIPPVGLAATLTSASLAGAAGALAASGSISSIPLITIMKTKILFGFAGLIMAGGLVTQHYSASRMAAENEVLRQQLAQQPPAAPAAPNPQGAATPEDSKRLREEHDELMRLRGEYGALLKQRSEIAELTVQLAEARKQSLAAKAQARRDVEKAYDGAAAMAQSRDIVDALKMIGIASRLFANDNTNLHARTFEAINKYLPSQSPGNIAPEFFEFVPQDHPLTVDDANLFLMREKAPRKLPNGHFMRAYLNGDGSVQMMTSPDGNYDAIEAAQAAAVAASNPLSP